MRKQAIRPKHIVLRRPDGSIRLILPTTNSTVLRAVLDMYFPSRLLGMAYKYGLKLVMPIQARLGRCEDAGATEDWCPGLAQALRAVPAAQTAYVGALISEPGPLSKLTLKIMNPQGCALAYGRIGYTPAAISMIRREAAVLQKLEKTPVARQVPRLLGAGDLAAQAGCFLVETSGPDSDAGNVLTQAHFEFLAGLASSETRSWADVVNQLEQEASKVFKSAELAKPVHRVLQQLLSVKMPNQPVVIEHGDFAPWNLRLDGEGKIYALDWEYARLDGLPWMDALHFAHQYSKLVLQADAVTVLQAMRGVFSFYPFDYFNGVLVADEQMDAYIQLYLTSKYLQLASVVTDSMRSVLNFENSIIDILMTS